LTSCQINPAAAPVAVEDLVAETLGTAEVVAEDVAEAAEISRASLFALLIVGGEVISAVTSAVAAVVVLRALESLSEYYSFHSLFAMSLYFTDSH
jgi:hypothetical protein